MAEAPFDRIVGSVDPAMVIVTAAGGGDRSGCLVGFHTQAGIDPERYAVWISKANHTHAVAVEAEWLAVHFLTSDDVDLARLFGTTTGDQVDKFAGLAVTDGPGGVPVLDRCPNRIVGRRVAAVEAGTDHTCVTVSADDVTATDQDFEPLRLSSVIGLQPGHEAEERR